jgi:hypothetical protein
VRDVKLQKECRQFQAMHRDRGLAHQHEVVMDAPAANKRALIAAHQLWHPRREADGKKLGHQLGEGVDEADRTELLQVHRTFLFRQERDESAV